LLTLTLGGAIFIATFSVQTSMQAYVLSITKYFTADLTLATDRLYLLEDISRTLKNVPEVDTVEGWAGARVELLKEGDKPGESVNLLGPPPGSVLIDPVILKGRWILPDDQNAIVLNEKFMEKFPDLKVGDTLRLRVDGDKTSWVVVGFFQFAGKPAGFLAYTSYEYLSTLIHQPEKAYSFHIVSKKPLKTIEEQKQLGEKLEVYLEQRGYQIDDIRPGLDMVRSATGGLNSLVLILLVMALLAAAVGSIGLTGTLSMNVLERTREIAVLRSIGASNGAIIQLVLVEGLTIGFISCILSSLLAFPISRGLWAAVSFSLFGTDSNFVLNPNGFLLWMLVITVLTILASVMPAMNAARMTIREALAYE
jgi:putative ABC transport system permease protein